MKPSAYYLPLLLLFLGSCSSAGKRNPLNLFRDSQNLYHETLPSNEYVLGITGQIVDMGNFLAILSQNKGHALAIYDKARKTYLHPIAPIGQGPDEFSRIINLQCADSTRLYVHDSNRKEFVDYQITTDEDSLKSKKEVLFSWKPASFRAIKIANYFIRLCVTEEGMFALSNSKGIELGLFEKYPPPGENDTEYPAYIRSTSYQGYLAVHPKDSLFAFVPISAPIVQVFRVSENKIRKYSESFLDYAHPTIKKDDRGGLRSAHGDNPLIYLSVVGTRDYIYVLYSGRTLKEYKGNAFYGRDVLVFDWNCNPVKRYVLDVDVSCIEVSPDNTTLWAAAENPDPELVKFQME